MDSNDSFDSAKPRLIYDGDCGFCKYSVDYWHKLTGDEVEYKPYQEVADQYPDIPVEEFQRAVQYIAPDGEASRAAKASFLTLSHAPGKRYWLWLYKYIPGFALIAEMVYFMISKSRGIVYPICKLLWGSHYEPPTYNIVTWTFLRLFGIIFLIAFASFGMQASGLIGSEGIVPIADLVKAGSEQLGPERYWYIPMIFWLSSSDFMVQAVCYTGMAISVLLILNIWPRLCLLLLYGLYLSLIYAGQMFMSYQWDLLLLEISLIGIVLLSARTLGIWLLRWLLFRFMFAAGIVKVLSGDNSWWDFTALNYHFYTQPLPTPLAWYAQQLPEVALKSATALTLIIELALVFLIFFPRRLRFFAGYTILALQFAILLTGNYNFFNLTAIILCIPLFDDAALRKLMPTRFGNWVSRRNIDTAHYRITTLLASIFAIITISVSVLQFGIRFTTMMPDAAFAVNKVFTPLHMVSTYGPFAVMTKARNEIIIEGSNDGLFWYAYEFKYKPGEVNVGPKWNIPFQPRLDWQMWFAALSEPDQNPWFYRFMQRLLENSPSVTGLLKYNPFSTTGPTFLRAQFYNYNFTTSKEHAETGDVWKREFMREYLPSIRLQKNNS